LLGSTSFHILASYYSPLKTALAAFDIWQYFIIDKEINMNKFFKSSLVVIAVITSNISVANNISPDFLNNEIEIAHNKYLSSSTEVAIYALESIVRLLESDQSEDLLYKTGPANLSFSYIRLGFLYEKSGLKEKADIAFSKAVPSYKVAFQEEKQVTLKKLKHVVRMLDAHSS